MSLPWKSQAAQSHLPRFISCFRKVTEESCLGAILEAVRGLRIEESCRNDRRLTVFFGLA